MLLVLRQVVMFGLSISSLSRLGRAERTHGFSPRRFYRAAWCVVRQDILLVAWKLLADFFATVVSFATAASAVLLASIALGQGLASTTSVTNLVESTTHFATRPPFVIGALGLLGTVWMAGLMVDALFTGGIWTVLARGARGKPREAVRTFLAGMFARFPRVLALRVTALAAQWTVALLLATVILSLLEASTGAGGLVELPPLAKSFLWALGLTGCVALSGLTRLSMEVASAPLFVADRRLGDALFEGARMVAQNFSDLYQLFLVAASIWLVPLLFYWAVLMGYNLTMELPALHALFGGLRFVAQALVFVAAGVISLHFYGALFFYWSLRNGYIEELPVVALASDTASRPRRAPSLDAKAGRLLADEASSAQSDLSSTVEARIHATTLSDLLPNAAPHVVDLEDVLDMSRLADPTPALTQAKSAPLDGDVEGLDEDNPVNDEPQAPKTQSPTEDRS